MEIGSEKQGAIEITKTSSETVRCIIRQGDKILLLQKNKNALAPEKFEFPGGNIDSIAGDMSTLEEQTNSVQTEIGEEAGLDISGIQAIKVDQFDYEFQGKWEMLKRKVHLFLVDLPESFDMQVQTGWVESDFHKGAVWVKIDKLRELKSEGKLLGNSMQFEKALT